MSEPRKKLVRDMAWLRSRIKEDPTTGCWVWQGRRRAKQFTHQYGRIRLRLEGGKCQELYAHRLACALVRGPLPEGMFVLHTCDNPPCVNPAHLYHGTQRENVHDMFARGRAWDRRGTLNHQAKFTEEQVREIRSSALQTHELTTAYGVSKSAIIKIRARETYRNVV